MTRSNEYFLLAVLMIAFGTGSATAQQLAAESGASPVPYYNWPYYNWAGPYAGGHMTYDAGKTRTTLSDAAPAGTTSSFGDFRGGLQIGYNTLLSNRLLLGIEADVTFPYFLDGRNVVAARSAPNSYLTEQVEASGTLRGRLGYVAGPSMYYGTAGLAWSKERLVETPGAVAGEDKLHPYRLGFAVGGGAEFAFSPEWNARVEYLYSHFGNSAVTFPSGDRYASSIDDHSVRLGLNRKLGGGGGDAAGQPGTTSATGLQNWSIHGQATLVAQGYPGFRSPYMGTQSLLGSSQLQNTTSATAFIGFRPWAGTEFYVNPELMQGNGLSATFGDAGFPNGEAQKSGFPLPRSDMARMFVRQTIGLGGEQETIEDGPNQIAGKQDVSRITLSAGRFAINDVFGIGAYAGDPRRDFLNWNAYGWGSYDISMNRIGYTWGAIADLNQKDWALRLGYFLMPTISNANTFDTTIPERGQYTSELELRYSLFSQPGKLRLFGWLNRGTMGDYSAALALPATSADYPDIALTRQVRTNYGFVVSAEQAITGDLGVFSRVSWSPGQREIVGWTDVSEAFSIGAVLKGTAWGRKDDKIGVAGVIEGLSPQSRAYFAAGGLGILVGDGQLNYRPEKILETYYAYSVNKWTTLTADYQFIDNIAYNADRGPVSIFAARLHVEF